MRSERLAQCLALLASCSAFALDVWEQPFTGVRHLHRTGPANVDVHAAVIDLCARGVSVRHTGFDERGQRTSAFAESVGAQLAINADFFCRPQDVGPGSIFAPCVGHAPYTTYGQAAHDGQAWPGTLRLDSLLAFGADRAEMFDPDVDHAPIAPWMREALGGHWSLVRDGVLLPYDCPLAPQTGVGLTADHQRLIVAVADGRNGWRGMTCVELGALLQELGADRAFALDSGGSSTFWLQGRGVLNHPSDGSERVVASHLAVFADGRSPPPFCQEAAPTLAPSSPGATVVTSGAPGWFTAVSPVRLFDTRQGNAGLDGVRRTATGELEAGSTVVVTGLAAAGVPPGATAAALNLTAVDATGAGYATAWAEGLAPATSTLNFAPGGAVANLTFTGLAADRAARLSTSAPTQLIADLTGYFGPHGAGFTPEAPVRLLDSRAQGHRLTAGQPAVIAGAQGPATRALALSVTATQAVGAGYLTVFPCGEGIPGTSTVNFATNQTVAALALAKVGPTGVCAVASADTHLVVDRLGSFTEGSGLAYLPVAPVRLLDSRAPGGAWSGRTARDQPLRLPLATLPPRTGAVAVTLTVTEPLDDGYAAIFPCARPWPGTSNVNFRSGETVAVSALVASGAGDLCLVSNARTHVVVDLTGVFVEPALSTAAAAADGGALDASPLTASLVPGAAQGTPAADALVCSAGVGVLPLLALAALRRRRQQAEGAGNKVPMRPSKGVPCST
ncbi:MAG: phosphodiester glycosidase family protein [Myxococcaceae bacterium]|nr:phosphodiester glycosidase family protein [Myxococcaceae bacterium]